ncbi:transmembrane protein 234 isoform X2 [Ambystoma mexicanum]
MILVGILWGATNPFLKAGSEGLEKIKKEKWLLQLLEEMKFLLLNYKCLLPFLMNQCGSLLYYFTLASADLSLAVPICNTLASVITVGTGMALGEELGGMRAMLGMAIATIGVTLCVIASQ